MKKIFLLMLIALSHAYMYGISKEEELFGKCIFTIKNTPREYPRQLCRVARNFGARVKVRSETETNILIFGGAPGSGKTTLAYEFAKQTNSYAILKNAPNMFDSGIIGCGANNVNKAFDEAISHIDKTGESVVLIFDEIDALVKPEKDVNSKERMDACQAFNRQIDMHKKNPNLLIIGTTNRYFDCDNAFRDRSVYVPVDQPTFQEKKAILKQMILGSGKTRQHYLQLSELYQSYAKKVNGAVSSLIKYGTSISEYELSTVFTEIEEYLKKFVEGHEGKTHQSQKVLEQIRYLSKNYNFFSQNEMGSELQKITIELEDIISSCSRDIENILYDMDLVCQDIEQLQKNSSIADINVFLNNSNILEKKISSLGNNDFKNHCVEFCEKIKIFKRLQAVSSNEKHITILSQVCKDKSLRYMSKLVDELVDVATTREISDLEIQLIHDLNIEHELKPGWFRYALSKAKEYNGEISLITNCLLAAYALIKPAGAQQVVKTVVVVAKSAEEAVQIANNLSNGATVIANAGGGELLNNIAQDTGLWANIKWLGSKAVSVTVFVGEKTLGVVGITGASTTVAAVTGVGVIVGTSYGVYKVYRWCSDD